MIRLNVFIAVKEENREEVLTAAKALTEASLKDKGNIAYDVFESSTRKNVLMICETWKDEESLKLHQEAEHFKKYVAIIQNLAEMKLEKFDF